VSVEEINNALLQQIMEQLEAIASLHRIIDALNETIRNLQQTNADLSTTIDELNKTIDGLTLTIKELKEKLGLNSSNSSKPPSSDGYKKPSPKGLRKPSGKKAGGQDGHSGTTLNYMAEPDETVLHEPSACQNCPCHDTCMNNACVGETRQVIDAVVTVKVTDHQLVVIESCPLSGEQQKGEFPDDVKAPVQYGENLQALTVALNTVGAVSVNRTHEILSGVFGIPISTGTISNMVGRCAKGLTEIVETIRQKLTESALDHFDETGTRVDGKTMWVHSASNLEYTHMTINAKRGKVGMDAGGVLPYFKGTAVHDCWAAYWKFIQILLHALCCAHLLRELICAEENHADQKWATEFKTLLLEMKKARDDAVASNIWKLSEEDIQEFERRYDKIIKHGYAENPLPKEPDETEKKKRGRKKKGKTLALIERLDKYKASVCLFIHDFSVPFDNNLAERDIRVIKVKTKVSGCFRSLLGAQSYLKIMSYVSTAKKHGLSAYEAIRRAISGNPESILSRGT